MFLKENLPSYINSNRMICKATDYDNQFNCFSYISHNTVGKNKDNTEKLNQEPTLTSSGNVLKNDISSAGWSSPLAPALTFPGVASRTQT